MVSKSDLRLFSTTGQPIGNIVGVWENEMKSEMKILSIDADGELTGEYTSLVSETGNKVMGKLTGYIAGDTISWSVNWEPTYSSVTSWAGKVLVAPDGSPLLYSLWHLSRGVDKASDWWQSFLSGSDRFWRTGP